MSDASVDASTLKLPLPLPETFIAFNVITLSIGMFYSIDDAVKVKGFSHNIFLL